ncbi:hypothetical protein D3C84_1181490 [compost metagenome]
MTSENGGKKVESTTPIRGTVSQMANSKIIAMLRLNTLLSNPSGSEGTFAFAP